MWICARFHYYYYSILSVFKHFSPPFVLSASFISQWTWLNFGSDYCWITPIICDTLPFYSQHMSSFRNQYTRMPIWIPNANKWRTQHRAYWTVFFFQFHFALLAIINLLKYNSALYISRNNFHSSSSIDSPCNKMRNSLFFFANLTLVRRCTAPSSSSIIRKIVAWSEQSIGATEISRTARNLPQLFKCSFSNRK